jgi:hypothetical protein
VREDITGWVMSEHGIPDSRLTVIKQVEDHIYPSGQHRDKWLCRCSCASQTEFEVLGNKLRNGSTKSCGCWQRDELSIRSKKYNKYEQRKDEYGAYCVGWTTNTNKEFYFDIDRLDEVKNIAWSESIVGNFHSVLGYIPTTKNVVRMHTFLGYKNYDHIDRNELNNRSCNLRPCTQQENVMNHSIGSNNTSGIIGLTWRKERNKWQAQIGIDKTNKYLGLYDKKEDAIIARLNAELKYFGPEFAPQRHLFEQYKIDTKVGDN